MGKVHSYRVWLTLTCARDVSKRHTVVGYVDCARVSVPERCDMQVGWQIERVRTTHEHDGRYSPVTFLITRVP